MILETSVSNPCCTDPFMVPLEEEGGAGEEEEGGGEGKEGEESFNLFLYLEQSTNCRRNISECAKLQKISKTWFLSATESLNKWYTTRYPEYLIQTIMFQVIELMFILNLVKYLEFLFIHSTKTH